MATAAAAKAVKASTTAAVPPHYAQPTSNFSRLLRQSRFASFDPAIRQTYSAPPSHAHRGNWGLKRPINLRRREAYITLSAPFEDPAFFVEWSHGESQVRFIKRFEEMQVQPTLGNMSPWKRVVGVKHSVWMLDSEFCEPSEGPDGEGMWQPATPKEDGEKSQETQPQKPVEDPAKAKPPSQPTRADLKGYGKSGKGNYGMTRTRLQDAGGGRSTSVVPNIYRMSSRQFERYVARLRELRPAFDSYIQETAQALGQDGKTNPLLGKSMFELAQGWRSEDHLQRFLAHHTEQEFKDLNANVIEPRPHPVGALVYAPLTRLHTHLYAKYHPGIILHQDASKGRPTDPIDKRPEPHHLVSFGGLVARVPRKIVENQYHNALLDVHSDEGLVRQNIPSSVADMRLAPYGGAVLSEPPTVVGQGRHGLKGAKLETRVQIKAIDRSSKKDFFPGTYVAIAYSNKGEEEDEPFVKPALKPRSFSNTIASKPPSPKLVASTNLISSLRGLVNTPKRRVPPPRPPPPRERGTGM